MAKNQEPVARQTLWYYLNFKFKLNNTTSKLNKNSQTILATDQI